MIIHIQTKTELSVILKNVLSLVTLILKITILSKLPDNKTVHVALAMLAH